MFRSLPIRALVLAFLLPALRPAPVGAQAVADSVYDVVIRNGRVLDGAGNPWILADVAITIPLSPGFSSLNLGQSVMIIGYEWFQAGDVTPPRQLPERSPPAARKDLIAMFEHLERELDASGFIVDPEKRPSMVRNLRTMFERAELSEQEVRTLRGVIVSLVEGRRRPRRKTLKENDKNGQGEAKGT